MRQMDVYSNSSIVLKASHLPLCVSMEIEFVHTPLQLLSLTSISAKGQLVEPLTNTALKPEKTIEHNVCIRLSQIYLSCIC